MHKASWGHCSPGPAVSPGRERGLGPKASDPKDGRGHFLKAQAGRTSLKTLISNTVSKRCQLTPEPGSVLSSRVLPGTPLKTASPCISAEPVLAKKSGTQRKIDETPENVPSVAAASTKG